MIKIGIVGLGLMGGSLASSIKKFVTDSEIYGLDLPDIENIALDKGIIDFAVDNVEDFPEGLDILFLASPISVNLSYLDRISKIEKLKKTLVTDLGSTKVSFMEKAQKLVENGYNVLGGHPMVGSEKSGIEAINPYLYQNAVYILCLPDGFDIDSKNFKLFIDILYTIGARIIKLDAHKHDFIISRISHLPHIIAVSLINFIEKYPDSQSFYKFAGGGYRDLTRIANSSVSLWKDILLNNKGNVISSINDFIEYLYDIIDFLKDGKIEKELQKARRVRAELPADNKGFINPLSSIRVEIEDKVGVLSDITTILAGAGISIKDIAILKIRENLGGVLELSFDDFKTANKAKFLLNQKGYEIIT